MQYFKGLSHANQPESISWIEIPGTCQAVNLCRQATVALLKHLMQNAQSRYSLTHSQNTGFIQRMEFN